MSTKIYNGHEIVGYTLDSFLLELRKLRAEIAELHQELLAKVIANMVIHRHDQELLGMREASEGKHIRFDVERDIHARMKKSFAEGSRDPFIDFTFSVCVIPVDGRLLAMTFCDQKAFSEVWNSKSWRKDFAYWNNTDEPEDVSQEDWEARGELWDKALGESGVPGEAGYYYDLTDARPSFPYVPSAEILAHVPSVEERVKRQLADYLSFKRKQRGEEELCSYRETLIAMQSEEGVQTLAELTALFEQHPLLQTAL